MTHTTSKTIRKAYAAYKDSNTHTLWACYSNPSEAKRRAFDECIKLCEANDGARARIIGHNSMVFSFGFIGTVGNRRAFFYITRDNRRWAYIDELEG